MKLKPLMIGALVAAVSAASAVSRAAAQAPDGKALFEEHCKKCHGVAGTPPKAMKEQFPKVATFNDAKFVASHSVDSIVKILTRGKGEDMKSFKMKLTPPEMMAVASYVREFASKSHP